jgi:polyhydroxyalkanoate synthesis regulator phasin
MIPNHPNETRRRGFEMATRQSVDHFLEQCEGALHFAEFEFNEASRQEHYDDEHFQNSQRYIEEALTDMERLYASSNDQQREMLSRMKQQLNQLRNEMILLRH